MVLSPWCEWISPILVHRHTFSSVTTLTPLLWHFCGSQICSSPHDLQYKTILLWSHPYKAHKKTVQSASQSLILAMPRFSRLRQFKILKSTSSFEIWMLVEITSSLKCLARSSTCFLYKPLGRLNSMKSFNGFPLKRSFSTQLVNVSRNNEICYLQLIFLSLLVLISRVQVFKQSKYSDYLRSLTNFHKYYGTDSWPALPVFKFLREERYLLSFM